MPAEPRAHRAERRIDRERHPEADLGRPDLPVRPCAAQHAEGEVMPRLSRRHPGDAGGVIRDRKTRGRKLETIPQAASGMTRGRNHSFPPQGSDGFRGIEGNGVLSDRMALTFRLRLARNIGALAGKPAPLYMNGSTTPPT